MEHKVKKLGIVLHLRGYGKGYMLWQMDGGWLLWAPEQFKHGLVGTWNSIVCFLTGHDHSLRNIAECIDDEGYYNCTMCCKRLKQ